MPRISGQEYSATKPQHNWRELESMIFENLFFPVPEEMEQIRSEVKKFLEENKDVCEIDKRDND